MRPVSAAVPFGGSCQAVQFMINEARNLTDTFSDGVGIPALQENSAGPGYEPTPLPKDVASRVTSIDRSWEPKQPATRQSWRPTTTKCLPQ